MHLIGSALERKRLELLHELVPAALPIGVLVNPQNPDVNVQLHELQEAAGVIKATLHIVRARYASGEGHLPWLTRA